MIQDIITYLIVAVAVAIAGTYIYKMFFSKKNSGCAGCGATECALRDKIKKKEQDDCKDKEELNK